ncbi:hypothetical protein BVG19_g5255 [[Candida] boidinii]|nr:hypothetical protein BVG19_g5255 [[Candida] boidinii]OWB53764.1 hypothetical protein B5S27_g5372 [[Candida] boidinii]
MLKTTNYILLSLSLFLLYSATTAFALTSSNSVNLSSWGDTIYNYNNGTVFVHIDDSLLQFEFNGKYTTNDKIESDNIIKVNNKNSKIIITNNIIYSIYPNDDNYINLSFFNNTSNDWQSISLINSTVDFYSYSSYLTTLDEIESIYIYGGLNSEEDASTRLLKLDLTSNSITEIETSISPSGFFAASNILINYNTQLVVGGEASQGWVNLKQSALWQYDSWSFKTVNINQQEFMSARLNPLLLPVFKKDSFSKEIQSKNLTDFTLKSVFMIGGEMTDYETYSAPKFSSLNLSDSSNWNWNSLDTSVALSNSETNNAINQPLALDQIEGALMLYDTFVIITDSSNSTIDTRDAENGNFYIRLYNSTNFQSLDSVDYTYLNNVSTGSKSNKSIIIAIAVIIPILFLIIVAILVLLLFRKYKRIQEEKEKEQELKNVLEFYKGDNYQDNPNNKSNNSNINHNGNYYYDNEYNNNNNDNPNNDGGFNNRNLFNEKSNYCNYNDASSNSDINGLNYNSPKGHTNSPSMGYNYFGDDVRINNYDDGDNLSLNSWRRKREIYEKNNNKRGFFHIPLVSKNESEYNDNVLNNHGNANSGSKDLEKNDTSLIRPNNKSVNRNNTSTENNNNNANFGSSLNPINFLKRSLSTMSQTALGRGRSLKTFITSTNSDFDSPGGQTNMQSPTTAAPYSNMYNNNNSDRSTLYLIPEDSSIKHKLSSDSSDVRSFYSLSTAYDTEISNNTRNSPILNNNNNNNNNSNNNNKKSHHHHKIDSIVKSPTSNINPFNIANEVAANFNKNNNSNNNYRNSKRNSKNRDTDIIDFDDDFLNPNLDVQVLVSSKRRSKLRIANPDPFNTDFENEIVKMSSDNEDIDKTFNSIDVKTIPGVGASTPKREDDGNFSTPPASNISSPTKTPMGSRIISEDIVDQYLHHDSDLEEFSFIADTKISRKTNNKSTNIQSPSKLKNIRKRVPSEEQNDEDY